MSIEAEDPSRLLRKQTAAIKGARKATRITASYFVDDFDDAGGIDSELSSNYTIDGGSVKVEPGQETATIISSAFTTNSIISTVEVIVASTPDGIPTIDVSADDGESWQTDVQSETPISIPALDRGKALRLRATLSRGHSLEYWSAHL